MTILSPELAEAGNSTFAPSQKVLENSLYRRALHSHYAAEAGQTWRDARLHSLIAICNGLSWQVTKHRDAIERIVFEDGKLGPILTYPENAHRLWQPEINIQIASCWLESHVKKYGDVPISRRTVNRLLQWLKDLGLLDWVEGVFDSKAPKSSAKSRTYTYIDVPRLLILQEAIEDHLLHKGEGLRIGLNIFPAHNYASSKLIHEMLFPGFGWNRIGDGTEREPQTLEESLARREFMAKQAEAQRGEYREGTLSALLQAAELGDEKLLQDNFAALVELLGNDKMAQWDVQECLEEEGFAEIAGRWLDFCRSA